MTKPIKLLIAYDGSPCADEALEDLQQAGLPHGVEAIVLSVADLWLLPAWLQWWPTILRQSWFLHTLRLERAPWTWRAGGAWLLDGALLVAAALAALGIVIPRELWRGALT